MLELVGTGKQVLDVGCATGYLARALVGQGCTVSGVELDEQAAEEARPALKELVIGNLEELDLTAEFGNSMFDAVIFGDVLEHVKDPLKVLRASLPLLNDGGFVVMSIPNVAHASVRLALLKGKFEYRELGLLDSTHLRFFTRSSLEELLRDAELVAVDTRRTTAGAFETEIRLEPADYPPELLAALSNDPDGRTYQFVLKAVPVGSSAALRRMHEQVTEQQAEIRRLRRALAAVLSDDDGMVPIQVGLWGHFGTDDLRPALLGRILRRELARRLPGATFRCFAPVVVPLRIDAGQPVEALGPWSPDRASALADDLDAVVVTGPIGVPPAVYGDADTPDHLVELDAVMYQGLGTALEERCPVLPIGVERSIRSPVARDDLVAALATHRYVAPTDRLLSDAGDQIPDPLLIIDRVIDPEQLRHRGDYLRLMGWFPSSGAALVVHGDGELAQFAPALGGVVHELAEARGSTCVLVETNLLADDGSFVNAIRPHLKPSARVVPIDAGVVDLLAALANADAVITSSPALFAAAFALGRPCAALDLRGTGRFDELAESAGIPDSVVRKPSELATALKSWPAAEVRATVLSDLWRRIDEHFDQVAAIISLAASSRRASGDAPIGQLSPGSRLRAVEAAHEGLLQRMAAERLAFADRAAALGGVSPGEVEGTKALLAAAEARIEAIYATRTMRTLRPVRELYGRARARSR